MRTRLLLLSTLLIGLSLACAVNGNISLFSPTATPTASPTPTYTPTPTATPTPTPTPTPEPAVRIESGDRALFNGDWDSAQAEFQAALLGSSDSSIQAAALLGMGRTYFLNGKYSEAIAALETLVAEYQGSDHAAYGYFHLGQAYAATENHSAAAEAYLNYMALRPGIVDGYLLEIRGDALFAAGDYTGAVADYQAALQAPSLNDTTFIEMKMARSYAVAGDTASALAKYDEIYFRTSNDNTRALINLRKGQIFTTLGQIESAHEVYLDSVYHYPTAYESYSALLALVEAGVTVNELNRGLVDYYAGEYGVALSAFDRYLQKSPEDPATARYFTALSTRALGGYQGAVSEWDKVIQNFPDHYYWDKAWDEKAYTQWAYLDQYTLAVETLLDFVSQFPGHARAGEFLYDAALVAEMGGELEQAAELWERVPNEYPAYEHARRALFLAGISRYRLGDHASALITFQRVLGLSGTLSERAASYLWIGKCQQELGDTEAARATWEQAAATDPTGYYSERARDLLRGRNPFTPPQEYDLVVDLPSERIKAETWMQATFVLPEGIDLSGLGSLASDPYLVRGAELWELGLYSQARSEFETLRQSLEGDPVQIYRLTNYLYELGLYRSVILGARQILNLAGMSDVDTMNAPVYFNHLRFGTYYSDLVIPIAQEYGFHPLLLFSLMRQESMFESFIRSSAAASGLMQIIPSTGAERARNMGWPPDYKTEDLNRPLVSLRLGTDYLNAQRALFDGDMYAALAAYNGGPGNAMAWKKLAPDDPDLFLEIIRFAETRTYIRSIYEFFTIYRNLYNRTP